MHRVIVPCMYHAPRHVNALLRADLAIGFDSDLVVALERRHRIVGDLGSEALDQAEL